MKDWIPLINKLVWPFIAAFVLLIFHNEVGEVYDIAMARLRAGGSLEIGGFLKLGEKADTTPLSELGLHDVPLEVVANPGGGISRGVTKDGRQRLSALQSEVENNPEQIINTLLIPNSISLYSIQLLKEYVSTLSLKYVVYVKNGKFDGWMRSPQFIAQLPSPEEARERRITLNYQWLRNMKGINTSKALPTASAKEVLELMQSLRTDSLPVVGENGNWLYVVNREDILSTLMTSLLVNK